MIENIKGSTTPQEPCLVKAGQGFSILYKERYLYSKYSPDRAILQTISNLNLLPGSLILCFSPLLWYGMKELIQKLPENCTILAIEEDDKLYELSLQFLNNDENLQIKNHSGFYFYSRKKTEEEFSRFNVNPWIKKQQIEFPDLYNFKRVISIDFSGGTFFCQQQYQNTLAGFQYFISDFWKNRLTLTKLGRLYSKNLFKNLSGKKLNFIDFNKTKIDGAILIFGAGESTESFINAHPKTQIEQFTIFAVDAALPALQAHNIDADFIIGVEGQLAIEKAYIGNKNLKSILLSDICGRNSIVRNFGKNTAFFMSDFANATFIKKARELQILPQTIPALGSVGLTAVLLALNLRKDNSVPVLFTGLDFSFTPGKTHCKNAPAHISRLILNNRFTPVENYPAAFRYGAHFTSGKNGQVITDTALFGYAELFKSYFTNIPDLFDAGISGLDLSIPLINCQQVNELSTRLPAKKSFSITQICSTEPQLHIQQYIENEKKSLQRLKTLLTKGEQSEPAPEPSLSEEISFLLKNREYLYLHFPDGYKCNSSDLSFLKRVRSEIDFFDKYMSQ